MALFRVLTTLFFVACAGLAGLGCSAGAKYTTVAAISPAGSFTPATGAELLKELNAQLPFAVSPKQFLCKVKGPRIVGWALITGSQKEVVKSKLASSSTLKLTMIESMTPEFGEVFKKEWKLPEDVIASGK